MSLKKLMSILCMLAISLFVFTSCEDDEVPPIDVPENITVRPVGELAAGQTGNLEITIMWEKSLDADSAWFKGYEITMPEVGYDPITVAKGLTTWKVTELDPNTTYTFNVVAVGVNPSDNQEVRSTVKTIKWACATHFTKNENEANIYVYCKESTDFGSGLQFYGPNKAPRTRKVANGTDWNIAVGSKTNLIIGSASSVASPAPTGVGYNLTGTPDNYLITSPIDYDTDVLTDFLLYRDLSTLNYNNTSINLTTNSIATQANRGIIFFAKGNGHYARIVVLKNANGGYLHAGTSNNPYVHLLVSYQTRSDVPYAKPTN